jgi:hypothetical protein
MNCATHPETTAAAYCRTCGKALCENCKRDIHGVIYCEPCIAARLQDTIPAAAPPPPPIVISPGGPNPTVAGVLAGFLPFGVGQAYCGQYSKGLAHMAIFIALVWASDNAGPFEFVFGITLGAFYFYQIIDAVRTAKHIQQGLPAPDPFGLGALFGGKSAPMSQPSSATYPAASSGTYPAASSGSYPAAASGAAPSSGSHTAAQPPSSGDYSTATGVPPSGTSGTAVPPSGMYSGATPPYGYGAATPPFGYHTGMHFSGHYPAAAMEHAHGAPVGPIVLIAVGILILLTNLGHLHWNWAGMYWPLILIFIGVWHGWRRLTSTKCQCARCRANCVIGPLVPITLGILFLLSNLGIVPFGHSWPVILIVVGLGVLFKHHAPTVGHVDEAQPPFIPPPGGPPPSSGSTGTAQLTGSSSERQNW